MLEYLPWKKHARKDTASADSTSPQPVLSKRDEEFLKKTLEEDAPVVLLDGEAVSTGINVGKPPGAGDEKVREKDNEKVREKDKEKVKEKERDKEKEKDKTAEWREGIRHRWEGLRRSASSAVDKRRASKGSGPSKEEKGKWKEVPKEGMRSFRNKLSLSLTGGGVVEAEKKREQEEFRSALDGLNLAAENGRAFSISPATALLLDKFTQILKDIVNGVPTAYNDLVELLENSSKTLEDTFSSLPSFLQKMIKTLPEKMRTNLAPEVLHAAASSGILTEPEKFSLPTLKDLVAKPGLLGMLKSVVSVLRTRFPVALGGANLALSLALFVLFVLWYCHKRGREERLERERLEALLQNKGGEGGEGSSSAALPFVLDGAVSAEKEKGKEKEGKGEGGA